MNFAQAKHNEDLSRKLHSEGKWNDWVITTAFYAALHYVDERLFPLKIKDTEYKSFDDYYSKHSHGCRAKHEARLKLVDVHLHKAYTAFRWLETTSRTVRYNEHDTQQGLADQAMIKLAVVKSLCIPTSAQLQLQPANPAES